MTPNSRLICKIFEISGMDCAPSHLETDCRETSSFCASSSCDQPAFLRRVIILSAKIISFPPVIRARSRALLPVSYRISQLHTRNSAVKSVNRRLHFVFFGQKLYLFLS